MHGHHAELLLSAAWIYAQQVLKRQLAVNVPFLTCGDFMYEEGEGLEEDEVGSSKSRRSFLPPQHDLRNALVCVLLTNPNPKPLIM
jgi:hypothetical protein